MTRMDETQHRLLEWTHGQHSERLAALVLAYDGWEQIDPSHPYGGKDGGKDLICYRDGKKWVGAVHFPRGRVTYGATKKKLRSDVEAARAHAPYGVVFVTNQEVSLMEREKLDEANPEVEIEIYHMERVALILDNPGMHSVRAQYLDIDTGKIPSRTPTTCANDCARWKKSRSVSGLGSLAGRRRRGPSASASLCHCSTPRRRVSR